MVKIALHPDSSVPRTSPDNTSTMPEKTDEDTPVSSNTRSSRAGVPIGESRMLISARRNDCGTSRYDSTKKLPLCASMLICPPVSRKIGRVSAG